MSKKKAESATLGDATWLLERMNAKHHPITQKQVQGFGKYPDAVLSDLCLEARLLPRELGKENPVDHLFLSSKEEACITACQQGSRVLVQLTEDGPKIYDLGRVLSTPSTKLLGCYADMSVFLMSHRYMPKDLAENHPWDLDRSAPTRIQVGERTFYSSRGRFQGATLRRDGSLLTALCNEERGEYRVVRLHVHSLSQASGEERLVEKTFYQIEKFFEVEDRIFFIGKRPLECGGSGRSHFYEIRQGVVHLLRLDYGGPVRPEAVVLTSDGVRFIMDFCDGKRWRVLKEVAENYVDEIGVGGVGPYIQSFTELEDEQIAYVTQSPRDQLTSWAIINGSGDRVQPGFDAVSPLFQRDGQYLYYGIVGRHIFTMVLPLND
jgi:hypothetical protein